MRIKDMPKSHRPRERLVKKGPENIANAELMAILLRTGTKKRDALELSRFILRKYPMKKLLSMSYDDLVAIDGIDSAKATTLLAAFELSRRALEVDDNSLPLIRTPQDAVDQLSELRSYKKEHFVALYLSAPGRLLHKETLSVGTLTASLVHPRETFEYAIKHHAAQIIVAHNHPYGDPTPSKDDIALTKRLMEAGELLGIEVVDHIIIAGLGYTSMKEEAMLG